jgi:molybdopterin-containing oxidoreductase family iron-sulfur binding subunit
MEPKAVKLDTQIGAGRAAPDGKQFWRSLEELSDDDAFAVPLRREFPEYANRLRDAATRREFLQLMGASLALAGVQGCMEQPQEQIVPYVEAPERLVPGKPLYYATATTHDGAAIGLLAESHMGRPVKVEGNPLHPAVPEIMAGALAERRVRFGATDAFAQASVLSLYDPDRSQAVTRSGQITTWTAFLAELANQLGLLQERDGQGLRLLTGTVVSPTLGSQLQALLEQFPQVVWHQYEAVNHDNTVLGSRLAFGEDVVTVAQVELADIILSLDADFLSEGPQHLQYARGFANRRRVALDAVGGGSAMNRLYVVESTATLTGATADNRLATSPRGVADFALACARGLGFADGATGQGETTFPPQWVSAVVGDLQATRGRCLVVAGRGQPPLVHALAHWMNQTLGNVGTTVQYRAPVAVRPEIHGESLRSLVAAMQNSQVNTLVILDCNPVYDAPADLNFDAALRNVPFSIHWGLYQDETTVECQWQVPATHALETWSDTRGPDGTATIVQPLIAPLFGGKTAHELIAAISGQSQSTSYEIVRDYWRRRQSEVESTAGNFEDWWKTALHDGIVAGTQAQVRTPTLRADFDDALASELQAASASAAAGQLELCFRPDPSVWDGRFANNGWLQELPRPLTTLTWDNAAHISPTLAGEHQLRSGDVVEIACGEHSIRMPVIVVPGQPSNSITLPLGYGRNRAGRIGNGVGVNVYPLRTSDAMWTAQATSFRKTGEKYSLAVTQHHHLMEGRHIVRAGTLAEFVADAEHPAFMHVGHKSAPDVSMYPEWKYEGYKWGMSINQSACIGCNACVVACQAENNIPIVGKDQVVRGREMHWLRIDHYREGPAENPWHYHQPMLCVHCELAPCEPVCPVEATTHSSEGINEMTYNRCVGTRYCANNCPYKVRRFNFLEYNKPLENDPIAQLRPNPDVTVRERGVMEKCTYCIQRINAARITAEKEDRRIGDAEVVTACQAACPTEAIIFGDLNDSTSAVLRAKQSVLDYAVLGELNTRPRTTHLAAVRNPHPALVQPANSQNVD